MPVLHNDDVVRIVDDVTPSKITRPCPANVCSQYGYEACGKQMRKHKDGSTHCPFHGEMH